MADYGLRVSQDGVDVLTGPDSGMIFTPTRRPVKVAYSGTFSITIPASTGVAQATFFAGINTSSTVYSFTYATDAAGVMRRGGGLSSITDYIGTNSYMGYLYLGGGVYTPKVIVQAGRTTSSSTWASDLTVTGKYYMVVV